ncbi:MAG: hypothetical protein K6G27_11690 [Lachnospiraceae bacterium]|nr:hypothetical protein [Lachnospiraceae bacterium]
MADQDKIINDEALKEVNGGAEATGQYVFNADGSVAFRDKNGAPRVFTAQEWQRLRNRWAYTNNPEYYISTVPLSDLELVLRNPGV